MIAPLVCFAGVYIAGLMPFPTTFYNMRYFLPLDITPYPNILAYLARISQRPAYQAAMKNGDPGMALLLT